MQRGQAVIDHERAFDVEGLRGLQTRPKISMFFGRIEGMRGITGIEVGREPHPLVLDRQRHRMGIGDQHTPLAAFLELQQKILGTR